MSACFALHQSELPSVGGFWYHADYSVMGYDAVWIKIYLPLIHMNCIEFGFVLPWVVIIRLLNWRPSLISEVVPVGCVLGKAVEY